MVNDSGSENRGGPFPRIEELFGLRSLESMNSDVQNIEMSNGRGVQPATNQMSSYRNMEMNQMIIQQQYLEMSNGRGVQPATNQVSSYINMETNQIVTQQQHLEMLTNHRFHPYGNRRNIPRHAIRPTASNLRSGLSAISSLPYPEYRTNPGNSTRVRSPPMPALVEHLPGSQLRLEEAFVMSSDPGLYSFNNSPIPTLEINEEVHHSDEDDSEEENVYEN